MGYYFTLLGSPGRFGNHFFRNLYWSILAEKFNLKIQYTFREEISALGFQLYEGEIWKVGDVPLRITEENMMDIFLLKIKNSRRFNSRVLVWKRQKKKTSS